MTTNKSNAASESELDSNWRFVNLLHNSITAWVVLFLSLALTVLAYFLADHYVEQRAFDRFEFRSNEIVKAIKDRLYIYEQILWSGVGLMNASTHVDRQEFAKFVSTLDIEKHWPGIQGFGFSVPVSPNEKHAHETVIRNEGFSDYHIKPPGERDTYTAIIYLEPFDWRNQRAFGFDMWTNEMRREAMARARDDGVAATSGIITLVQETVEDTQRGFLMYVPVYDTKSTPKSLNERRSHFSGWIYAPFRAGNLMTGILGTEDSQIEFEIFDGEDMQQDALLFDSNNRLHLEVGENSAPKFSKTQSLILQGRPWTIYFNTPLDYTSGEENQPFYVLVAGAFVDLLLFYVIYSLYRINKQSRIITGERKLIIEQAPNALIMVNGEGTIVLANAQADMLFGYGHGELAGKQVEDLVPDSVKSKHPTLLQSFFKSPNARAMGAGRDLNGRRKDGSNVPLEIGLSPLKTQHGQFVIASIVNISERKKYQQVLERANKELEQFAYVASHDLKAPLRAIENLATWIKKDSDAVLPLKSKQDLELLVGRVDRMKKLLESLLAYSRIGRVEQHDETVDLKPLIKEIADLLSIPNTFSLNLSGDFPVFYGPRTALMLVLGNLIGNAIKHHHLSSGRIDIQCEVYDGHLLLTIKDDGPGIAEEYHEKVFGMFQTLKPRDEVEGSGMGLALVKKTVEYHGGTIVLHSSQGKGAEFIVKWPCRFPGETLKVSGA